MINVGGLISPADKAEALLRETRRREQIERAQKMLFDESDKVKALHSRVLLSDVIAEREKQMEYKKRIVSIRKEQEQEYIEQQRLALEAAEVRHMDSRMPPLAHP